MDATLDTPGVYHRILFCTDFSENAAFAFRNAVQLARLQPPGLQLHLLHVIPEPDANFWKTYIYEVDDVDAKARRDIDLKIDTDYRSRVPPSIDFHVHILIGRDYIRILEFAAANGMDLIVLGRQGHSSFQKIWFGNVTEKVVRHASCPVLVVPLSTSRGEVNMTR